MIPTESTQTGFSWGKGLILVENQGLRHTAEHGTASLLHSEGMLSQDGDTYAHLHSTAATAYSSTCSRVRDGRNGKQLVDSEESVLSQTRLPACFPHGFLT